MTFAHGTNAYEIDLTEANADKLQAALAPFVAAARRVDQRRTGLTVVTSDLRTIRAWARANGVKVSERGRVSQDVQDAFRAAH